MSTLRKKGDVLWKRPESGEVKATVPDYDVGFSVPGHHWEKWVTVGSACWVYLYQPEPHSVGDTACCDRGNCQQWVVMA